MTRDEYLRGWRETHREKTRAYNAEYRSENRERLAGQKAEWYRQNADVIRAKERQRRLDDGDKVREQNRRVVRRTERDPLKQRAHTAVSVALRQGVLLREPCEICGAEDRRGADGRILVQAHHDDYSKPLVVRWLCVDCHALHHRKVA